VTREEFDKLKDVTDLRCAIFQREQDGVVMDVYGVWWMTGLLNGEPVKRQCFAGARILNEGDAGG
jgi:hypothetical protein